MSMTKVYGEHKSQASFMPTRVTHFSNIREESVVIYAETGFRPSSFPGFSLENSKGKALGKRKVCSMAARGEWRQESFVTALYINTCK